MFQGALLVAIISFFSMLKNLLSYLYWKSVGICTVGRVVELQHEESFGYPNKKTEFLYAVIYEDNGEEKSGTLRSVDVHLKLDSEVEMLIDTKSSSYFMTKVDFQELKDKAVNRAKLFAASVAAAIVFGIISVMLFVK